MKYRCDHCNEYHEIGDLTINVGDEGQKLIDDIDNAVMGVVEKRGVPIELLVYAIAANLEQAKQAGLKRGKESHRIEMIIQAARNDVTRDIGIEEGEGSLFN